MYRFVLIPILLLISCMAPNRTISYTVSTKPVYPVDPPPQKILLLNTYDIVSKKYRDNKEELFISLINSLMDWMAGKIHEKTGITVQVLPGYYSPAGIPDSNVFTQMKENKASHAIVIRSFDIFFNQTHVEVVKTDKGGKERTAYYDIIADIGYALYAGGSILKENDIHKSRFHSSRSVISGLLATGPNIVVKRDDAMRIMLDNGTEFLHYYFPGDARRTRTLFTGKGLEAVKDAITRADYEAALVESLRLTNDPDKKRAAKACYNCAVFFERKNQAGEARTYLQRSLSLFSLPEARYMLYDITE